MDWYEILEINLGKNKYICFELFEVSFLNFPLKGKTMRNILNQNVTKLERCAIVFQTQTR